MVAANHVRVAERGLRGGGCVRSQVGGERTEVAGVPRLSTFGWAWFPFESSPSAHVPSILVTMSKRGNVISRTFKYFTAIVYLGGNVKRHFS